MRVKRKHCRALHYPEEICLNTSERERERAWILNTSSSAALHKFKGRCVWRLAERHGSETCSSITCADFANESLFHPTGCWLRPLISITHVCDSLTDGPSAYERHACQRVLRHELCDHDQTSRDALTLEDCIALLEASFCKSFHRLSQNVQLTLHRSFISAVISQ